MENENVIELRHISKSFPGIKANDDISLTLRKGEIHALLGENGAGKSTLMSILFGLYEPDEGQIFVNGKEEKIKNPNDANRLGIGMVHQHFKLVEVFTALQNIILGAEPTKFGFLAPKKVRASIDALCKKFNFKVNLDEKIDNMPVGEQQKVEILKMLYRQNDILIFDEPTAVLTPQEINELMNSMRELAKEGKSILFISHKLNEIMEVSDRVTVLQRGKCLGTLKTKDTNPQELSRLMVGRDVELKISKSEPKNGKEILTVKNLKVFNYEKKKETIHGINFNVRAGEIVCIAGIEGNGQTDLIYALTGLERVKSGEIILHNVNSERYTKKVNSIKKENWLKKFFRYIGIGLGFIWYHIKFGCSFAWYYVKLAFKYLGYLIKKLSYLLVKSIKKDKCNKEKPVFEVEPRNKYVSYFEVENQPLLGDVHLERISIRARNNRGLSHIPEDRHKHGLVLDFNLRDNLVLDKYFDSHFQKFGFINNKAREKYADELIEKYDIRSGKGNKSLVRSMSGGNQQKAIVARELERETPLLIAVQPTRGLDVGAIEAIHKHILSSRDSGNAVLLVSLELEEVMNLADRILVMYNGDIVGQFDPKNVTTDELGLYMSGAKKQANIKAVLKEGEMIYE